MLETLRECAVRNACRMEPIKVQSALCSRQAECWACIHVLPINARDEVALFTTNNGFRTWGERHNSKHGGGQNGVSLLPARQLFQSRTFDAMKSGHDAMKSGSEDNELSPVREQYHPVLVNLNEKRLLINECDLGSVTFSTQCTLHFS